MRLNETSTSAVVLNSHALNRVSQCGPRHAGPLLALVVAISQLLAVAILGGLPVRKVCKYVHIDWVQLLYNPQNYKNQTIPPRKRRKVSAY